MLNKTRLCLGGGTGVTKERARKGALSARVLHARSTTFFTRDVIPTCISPLESCLFLGLCIFF
jgi:hypothetical protein